MESGMYCYIYISTEIYREHFAKCAMNYTQTVYHGAWPGLRKMARFSALFRETLNVIPKLPKHHVQDPGWDHMGLLGNSQKLAFVFSVSSLTVSICNNNTGLF